MPLYSDLKGKVSALDKKISSIASDSILTDFAQRVSSAASTANAWSDQVTIPEIHFAKDVALSKLAELRECLLGLVEQKQANPIAAVGTKALIAKGYRASGQKWSL